MDENLSALSQLRPRSGDPLVAHRGLQRDRTRTPPATSTTHRPTYRGKRRTDASPSLALVCERSGLTSSTSV